jgi:hypothetical protein
MKPTLKLDTRTSDTYFSSPYPKGSPFPTPTSPSAQHYPQPGLEEGYPFPSGRSRGERTRSWISGKGRAGGRRYAVLAGFGLLWLLLFVYKRHVSQLSVHGVMLINLATYSSAWISYRHDRQHKVSTTRSWSTRDRYFVRLITARGDSAGEA